MGYVDDLEEFLERLVEQMPEKKMGKLLWPVIKDLTSKMKGPKVPVSIIFNDAQSTVAQVSYVNVNDDLSRPPEATKFENGDGTLLAASIEKLAKTWREDGAEVRILDTTDTANHSGLVSGGDTIKLIKRLLDGEDVKDRPLIASEVGGGK